MENYRICEDAQKWVSFFLCGWRDALIQFYWRAVQQWIHLILAVPLPKEIIRQVYLKNAYVYKDSYCGIVWLEKKNPNNLNVYQWLIQLIIHTPEYNVTVKKIT